MSHLVEVNGFGEPGLPLVHHLDELCPVGGDLVQPLLDLLRSPDALLDQLAARRHRLLKRLLVSQDLLLKRLVLGEQQVDGRQVVANVALSYDRSGH